MNHKMATRTTVRSNSSNSAAASGVPALLVSRLASRLALCSSLLMLLSACSSPSRDTPDGDSGQTAQTTSNSTGKGGAGSDAAPGGSDGGSSTAAARSDIDAEILSWKEIEERLASHAGKVVVADIWSTSCVPCMRELPHLFELQKKYPDQLVAVTINIDYSGLPDDPPEACKKRALDRFLRKKDAQGVHYVSSTEDTTIYETLDVGSIPVVLVYDTNGKLLKKFGGTGELSYGDEVIPFVEKLLRGESGPAAQGSKEK